ncbi:MAG TPA: PaaI family thioesterase [Anaerolineales bacterium]|nr:PaaI family thioesterase [Anaerolineales bacterium]
MDPSMKVLRTLPEHGYCFVCGKDNQSGMGVRWLLMEDLSISTEVTLDLAQQGPPGYAHGGASAALLDEAMGTSVWVAGKQAVAVNLQVNYLKPLPLHVPFRVNGRVEKIEGRKIFASSSISSMDGTILVNGQGIYIDAPQLTESVWEHIDTSK